MFTGKLAKGADARKFLPTYDGHVGRVPEKDGTDYGARKAGNPVMRLRDTGPRKSPSAYGVVPGYVAPSFKDDYYNRIHIAPTVVALGTVTNEVVQSFYIWAAYFHPVELQDLDIQGATGLTITNVKGESIPYTAAPLENIEYRVIADNEGPPTIDAALVYTFDVGVFKVTITGFRAVVWTLPHDWQNNLTEVIEYNTKIISSYNQTESRIGLFDKPKVSYETSHYEDRAAARYMRGILWSWAPNTFVLPLASELQIVEGYSIGDTILSVDTEYSQFEKDGLGVVIQDYRTYEVFEVATVRDGEIELKRPLRRNWSPAPVIAPARSMELHDQQTARSVTDTQLQADVLWQGLEFTDQLPLQGMRDYKGLPVVNFDHNWINQPEDNYNYFGNSIESEWLKITNKVGLRAKTATTYTIMLENRAKIAWFRQLVQSLRGRLNTFWVSTGRSDVNLLVQVKTNTELVIEYQNYAGFYSTTEGRNHLQIETVHGEYYYNKVVAVEVSADGETETLTMEEQWAVPIPLNEVYKVSFLSKARLDSDRLEIAHKAQGFAEASLPVMEL